MLARMILLAIVLAGLSLIHASALSPAPQNFKQELMRTFPGAPSGDVQLVEVSESGVPRHFSNGAWFEFRNGQWMQRDDLNQQGNREFVLADQNADPIKVAIPWRDVLQVLRAQGTLWVATAADPFKVVDGQAQSVGWPSRNRVNQIALAPSGELWVASSGGLFQQVERGWRPMGVTDGLGRGWGVLDVLGVAFDATSQLWFATKAGVACRTRAGWKFFEGRDGLPWNDFTSIAAGPDGGIWFSTKLGAIHYAGGEWHYRQGPAWLPHDELRQIAVDSGGAWLATKSGVGRIEFAPMTLAEKAARYEKEIQLYVKRTPYGFVAEAPLARPADRSTARPNDSDNDGLWTAMYGAGECFAYAATKDPAARQRAKSAFEALRFLQTVTQGGSHSPPPGYIARTVLPADGPDPNIGRLERDRDEQKSDRLWKVYEPRWPKSADGKWFWKSDTSSDELDGHYFFYPLYFEFCAETPAEKDRVREVVRGITDHLLAHDFNLVDHDGRPTRWGIYGPKYLNNDPDWWAERGLKSLSILSYLAGATYVTGDPKYEAASRELIDKHGYAHNLMFPKVQHGPGSGNQSDDEMAVMCFHNLLRYSRDEKLKTLARYSFYRYWANEAPEMNPFFNFAYAGVNLAAKASNPWGEFSIAPWAGWLEDSMATLYGFPLDRLNWPRRNSHRLDLQSLRPQASVDLYAPQGGGRGHRLNGKVLPVENRHFNHWNTDPWRLDYGGDANELAAGTVFLLPYYMGQYYGFIEK